MRNRGGGDEDEAPSKKKSPGRIAYEKMMQQKRIVGALQAEQNAKAAQAQATKIAKATQADMTEAEKLAVYKQTAGYIARQESLNEYERQKALEAQRAGERNAVSIAEEYKAREQAKQNAGGGKPLAVPARQDPNPPEEKTFWEKVKDFWHKIWNPERPIAPTVAPFWLTPSPTVTPMPLYTTTPQVTVTPQPTSTYLEDRLGRYGISTIGDVDLNTLQVILDTTNLLGKNYMPFLNAPTPESAFLRSNGEVLIILDDKATFFHQEIGRNGNVIEKVATGNCETRKNVLQNPDELNFTATYKINVGTKESPIYVTKEVQTFAPQAIVCKKPPTEENLMHEFGHTTPNHVGFDIFSNVDKILNIDGKYFDYNEDGGYWERDETGFLKGSKSLEHPITVEESQTDGYAKLEQLADMLMNWNMEQAGSTQYGFTNDPAGNARREYTLSLIREMLAGR